MISQRIVSNSTNCISRHVVGPLECFLLKARGIHGLTKFRSVIREPLLHTSSLHSCGVSFNTVARAREDGKYNRSVRTVWEGNEMKFWKFRYATRMDSAKDEERAESSRRETRSRRRSRRKLVGGRWVCGMSGTGREKFSFGRDARFVFG